MAPSRAPFSDRPRWISASISAGFAGILIAGGATAPVVSAMPEVTLGLAISPAHVGDSGVFTLTGTVTPNVPISGVKLVMTQTAGVPIAAIGCAPAANCWTDSARVYFELPSVGAKATVSAQFQVNTAVAPPVGFDFGLNAPEVMVLQPKTVYGYGPMLKMSITRTSGTLIPGSTVHVVAKATTSVGPVQGVLIQVTLPPGLEPPTNLSSSTARWVETRGARLSGSLISMPRPHSRSTPR